MTEYSLSALIGVACGVLTAFLLIVLGDLWSQAVLPLLRRWRYRGVNICGEWKGLGTGYTPAFGEWSEVALSLEQDTYDVCGQMTIRYRSAARSFELNLQAGGRVADGYVTLTFTPKDQAVTSVATALLKVDGDGKALTGQLLYRGAYEDTVDVINMSVHREAVAAPALHPVIRPALAVQGA
jgi:hypothetical protein